MAINRSHNKKRLDDLITNEGTLKEMGVTDAPVDTINWKVKEGEVHSSTRLEDDTGEGETYIMRSFEFRFPENIKEKPTKEQILTDGYKKFLEAQLYMVDNLELALEPRVIIEEKGFRIFATCRPRKGHMIEWRDRENVKTLTQIAHESQDGSTEDRD